ncbi:MAG TPA: GDP-mannose 4,6-dehydratase, partial [Nitrososphaeraceae archaeon]|nr:GDP-mannose 4,6-dehydratase [Nitrososphaeraceae archaeon]
MKNILITGGAGFVGHHLTKKLLKEKANRVIIIDNNSNTNTPFLKEFENFKNSFKERAVFYRKDIREPLFDIFQKEDIDTCIHLAAKISILESILKTEETIDVNVKGTLNVLEACSNNNVKNFVFASSAAVYGSVNKWPITEDFKLEPLDPYGASKIAGEALVSAYKNLGKIPYAVKLRFFNIYGEGQSQAYAGVITNFYQRLSKGLAPIIFGNGKQTRDFVSVNDVVDAILLAAEAQINTAEAFNITVGKQISINELAKIMINNFGLDIEPIYEDTRPADPMIAYADVSKAKEILNFRASKDLAVELKNMFT